MMIRHHPNEATLLTYASGGLSTALSTIVATHLGLCPSCRARTENAEKIGGALLSDVEQVAMSASALDLVLARIDNAIPVQPEKTVRHCGHHGLPAPLGDLLPENIDSLRWWPVGPGIRQARLGEGEEAVRLLRISPGRAVPHHSHGGHEMTMIVSGSYTDEIGRFMPGDVADLDPEVSHQPVSDAATDCICVIATDAPLNFTGWVPRLMQSLVRI
ncbi:MAG: ChrR family anti-sigma-E factor [Minwuia sp.]|nr:ChrR family anti-sigma-E factor [Minwuia sp.]